MELGLGICDCGYMAVERCAGCGALLCASHTRCLPDPPAGISTYALGLFVRAIRATDGVRCRSCRAALGRRALQRAFAEPREPLPDHWLDRAIALRNDQTRSDAEKEADGRLPPSVTATDIVGEFLRRIDRKPSEHAPVSEDGLLRGPHYVDGWRVACRRTEYAQRSPSDGSSERYPLPLLITPGGELLGPALEADDRPSAVWGPVPESDIELQLLLSGVANILTLSRYAS